MINRNEPIKTKSGHNVEILAYNEHSTYCFFGRYAGQEPGKYSRWTKNGRLFTNRITNLDLINYKNEEENDDARRFQETNPKGNI